MRDIGIGHNKGPALDAGRSWRRFAWTKARAEIAPKAGIETVRRYVRRAAALGMTYPQYASVRLGTGRDVAALLFTAGALGWRRGPLPETMAERLGSLDAVDCLLLARLKCHEAGTPTRSSGIRFAAAGPPPRTIGEARAAIRVVVDPIQLPGDAVVMIGSQPKEAHWAGAARLARFIDADAYFGAGPHG